MININSRPCVSAVLIHRGNRLLLLDDPKTNMLSLQMTRVQREHMAVVVNDDQTDGYLKTLRQNIDVDADIVNTAFAYTALKNACKTFSLDVTKLVIRENCCLITDHLLKKNTKGYNIKCFEIELGMDQVGPLGFWVDDEGLHAPNNKDLFYKDKPLTTMAGYMSLLFFDHLI